MTPRRKLKDAIAENDELSFVFGQAITQKITQIAQETKEQLTPHVNVLCTYTFVPDGKPVRHYYDLNELSQWAFNDIKPNGIRSPLWVRPHPDRDGKYELVAGLRRFKAAGIIGMEAVPIKIFNWDNRTAFQAAISENANRRDFSALEELDNTLRLLEIQLGYKSEEVIRLLYRMNNAAKSTTNQNVLVSQESEIVKQVFDAFGNITWQSFVTTRLPLLKKPQEILDKIRQGEIQYTKGVLIASLKDTGKQQKLIAEVIRDNLTLSEIKQRIQAINSKITPSASTDIKQRLIQTVQMIKKDKALWSNPDKIEQLEQLLSQLETIITKE
jgi:ParB family transcriptional regulator, chromosome partitioning protein